jgi:hypothetical protein
MKKRRLRLVSADDPSKVFDNLDALRLAAAAPLRHPRARATETFARIPHDRGLVLCRYGISIHAWAVLIELDRLILKAGGKNPVRFWSSRLRALGLVHQTRARALRQLEAAGVIKVCQRGKGLSPWVTHLWYERRD